MMELPGESKFDSHKMFGNLQFHAAFETSRNETISKILKASKFHVTSTSYTRIDYSKILYGPGDVK